MWLFSVGPLGVEVKDAEQQPKEMAEFQQAIRPRGEHIFFGALDHSKLSFPERRIVKAVRAPEGDFRDWEAIEDRAASIAQGLGCSASGLGCSRVSARAGCGAMVVASTTIQIGRVGGKESKHT